VREQISPFTFFLSGLFFFFPLADDIQIDCYNSQMLLLSGGADGRQFILCEYL
jgi:hypothetical protein